MKLLFVIALLAFSISANAGATMILFQPAITAANDSSSSEKHQAVQASNVEKTDAMICYSETLTTSGLPIVLSKAKGATAFKMNMPKGETYDVYTFEPNQLSLENKQYSYRSVGTFKVGAKAGEFALDLRIPGSGQLQLRFPNKNVIPVAVTCTKVDNR